MSTKRATFPFRRPVGQPPPLFGVIENGRSTPKYVLAWVCNPTTFFKNLGGGELGKVHYCNFSDVVSKNWRTRPKFGFGLRPLPYPGPDGNFYLIAMFNEPEANHIIRVRNLAQDPLIESARVSMGVDKDQSLEKTLQWFRWPLNWLQAEERQREMAVLAQQERDSDGEGSDKSEEDSG
ncbi:hypothetical protein DFH07DRAFT_900173 [Mycena maculata]|uniref:Uncharacterized protein n=1 Tax=Mycena maculata TaxID=230809 RepID=A0AAD7MEW7_9AGAR|nr:hypothetical protein DFH07DRAFT_900173 [Mycena maculata]